MTRTTDDKDDYLKRMRRGRAVADQKVAEASAAIARLVKS